MSVQTILRVIPSVISLPGSAGGALRCNGQGLLQTELSGQAPAPAKTSVAPGSKKGLPVNETSGPRSSISSASVALTESLANRLKLRLATVGSTVYRQTWKEKVTPLGRRYWAHTARVPTTNGKGCTGWPTPQCADENMSRTEDPQNYSARMLDRPAAGSSLAHTSQALVGWLTPNTPSGGPNATDGTNPDGSERSRMDQLLRQASLVISGQTQSPTSAKTESCGVLNPAFSRWLQSFPEEWCQAAVSAFRSMPTKRRKRA